MTGPPSITCPRCGATSYHPEDIALGYCGRCHDYTSDPTLAQLRKWVDRGRAAQQAINALGAGKPNG
jgi:ribosomal protein L37E